MDNQWEWGRCAALALMVTASAVMFDACANKIVDDGPEEEEVLPNEVTLTLTVPGTSNVVHATFRDADGIGGAGGTSDTLVLAAGTNYTGMLAAEFHGRLPGASRDTTIDITPDYVTLGTEHQFFYTMSGPDAPRVTITLTDKDSTNLPLGLATAWQVSAGGSGSGTLRVELGHYGDPARPKNGTLPPYERDIDITFPVAIR